MGHPVSRLQADGAATDGSSTSQTIRESGGAATEGSSTSQTICESGGVATMITHTATDNCLSIDHEGGSYGKVPTRRRVCTYPIYKR